MIVCTATNIQLHSLWLWIKYKQIILRAWLFLEYHQSMHINPSVRFYNLFLISWTLKLIAIDRIESTKSRLEWRVFFMLPNKYCPVSLHYLINSYSPSTSLILWIFHRIISRPKSELNNWSGRLRWGRDRLSHRIAPQWRIHGSAPGELR
jgi:hypothetical protein